MSDNPSSDVTMVDSGPTFEVWRGRQGVMRLDWNRTNAVRIYCSGHGHAGFVAPMLPRFEDAIRNSKTFMQVCDWWELNTYDPGFRVDHGNWISSHMSSWAGAHVLQRSKLVSMGLAVANLGLGGRIKTYTSRVEFEKVARQLGFMSPPTVPAAK